MEVIIRDYHENDLEEIKRLHEKGGLDFRFPDLGAPIFLIKKVAELDNHIIACGVVRLEAELMLWVNHEAGTPEERWDAVRRLNEEGMEEAYMKGLNECVCWVPELVEKSFSKRLKDMGFTKDRDGWRSYSRPTEK